MPDRAAQGRGRVVVGVYRHGQDQKRHGQGVRQGRVLQRVYGRRGMAGEGIAEGVWQGGHGRGGHIVEGVKEWNGPERDERRAQEQGHLAQG